MLVFILNIKKEPSLHQFPILFGYRHPPLLFSPLQCLSGPIIVKHRFFKCCPSISPLPFSRLLWLEVRTAQRSSFPQPRFQILGTGHLLAQLRQRDSLHPRTWDKSYTHVLQGLFWGWEGSILSPPNFVKSGHQANHLCLSIIDIWGLLKNV